MDPTRLADVLERVRARGPLVQYLTNTIVQNVSANVLLAVGASPAMVNDPADTVQFTRLADAVLINLGTLSDETQEAMRRTAPVAADTGTPWVLDPIAVGVLDRRTTLAHELLTSRPTVIRANASEVLSLAGEQGGAKGVDSSAAPEAALDAATALAHRTGGAVAVSGPVDVVTDGTDTVRVHNGSPLLTQVTGTGCALGALVAACCAVEPDRLVAATAGTAILTVAADAAAARAAGPGSFAVGLLDELAGLTPDRLAREVRL